MRKSILINLLFFVSGIVVCVIAINIFSETGKKVTFISSFELNETTPNYISIRGSYEDKGEINSIALSCFLDTDICEESSMFITKEGINGLGIPKNYKIIEKTPTKIVARYDGLAAYHMYIIELDKRIVSFKNQSISNPSSTYLYTLEDGSESLKKASSY